MEDVAPGFNWIKMLPLMIQGRLQTVSWIKSLSAGELGNTRHLYLPSVFSSVQCAVLYCFGDVRGVDAVGFRKVCDGAGNF